MNAQQSALEFLCVSVCAALGQLGVNIPEPPKFVAMTVENPPAHVGTDYVEDMFDLLSAKDESIDEQDPYGEWSGSAVRTPPGQAFEVAFASVDAARVLQDHLSTAVTPLA